MGEHDTAVITAYRNDPSSEVGCVNAIPPAEQEDSPLDGSASSNGLRSYTS